MKQLSVARARKIAAALSSQVNERYGSVELSLSERIPTYISVEVQVEAFIRESIKRTQAAIDEHALKIDILFHLRREIGELNNKHHDDGQSVNSLLTEQKHTNVLIALYEKIAQQQVKEIDQLKLMHSHLRQKITERELSTPFTALDTGDVTDAEQRVVQLKRRLIDIEDRLAQINGSSTIVLTDSQTEFLSKLGLI